MTRFSLEALQEVVVIAAARNDEIVPGHGRLVAAVHEREVPWRNLKGWYELEDALQHGALAAIGIAPAEGALVDLARTAD